MTRFKIHFIFWCVAFFLSGALGNLVYDMFFPMCFLGLCIALVISGTDDELMYESDANLIQTKEE